MPQPDIQKYSDHISRIVTSPTVLFYVSFDANCTAEMDVLIKHFYTLIGRPRNKKPEQVDQEGKILASLTLKRIDLQIQEKQQQEDNTRHAHTGDMAKHPLSEQQSKAALLLEKKFTAQCSCSLLTSDPLTSDPSPNVLILTRPFKQAIINTAKEYIKAVKACHTHNKDNITYTTAHLLVKYYKDDIDMISSILLQRIKTIYSNALKKGKTLNCDDIYAQLDNHLMAFDHDMVAKIMAKIMNVSKKAQASRQHPATEIAQAQETKQAASSADKFKRSREQMTPTAPAATPSSTTEEKTGADFQLKKRKQQPPTAFFTTTTTTAKASPARTKLTPQPQGSTS